MSRLESFIRRMSAQRDCLNQAADMIADIPGVVLELGLGNGRTYDHLREHLPGREIYVFDLQVNAHPDCVPDAEHLFLGEIETQLPIALSQFGRTAAMIHSDVGTGDKARNARLAKILAPLMAQMLQPGGVLMADQAMAHEDWQAQPLPDGVPDGRYFIYRTRS